MHVAIIMDGNGRWAQARGKQRLYGHKAGTEAVRQAVEAAAEMGLDYLSLYAFSSENWNRPQEEVDGLMGLLVEAVHSELPILMKNEVRLQAIGDLSRLPQHVRQRFQEAIDQTAHNTGLCLVLALSYSGTWDILQAAKAFASDCVAGRTTVGDLDADRFETYLSTAEIPHPDLLIRTSGEERISNFMLWQLAYTEFYFTNILWPDFRKEDFRQAVVAYQKRSRRFGKTTEQQKNEI
jgi:undecaprenyl diphosphate synthase